MSTVGTWFSGQWYLLVDLVVIAIVAVAALRGWRRGGLRVTARVIGALAGLAVGSWAAGWLLPQDGPTLLLTVACLAVGVLLGMAVGARIGSAARPGHGRPVLPDRMFGVAAYAALAVVACVLAAGALSWVGPPAVSAAVGDSSLPAPSAVLDRLPAGPALAGEVGR